MVTSPWVVPTDDRWVWAAIEAAPALVLLLNYRGIGGADPEHRPACKRFVFLNGLAPLPEFDSPELPPLEKYVAPDG